MSMVLSMFMRRKSAPSSTATGVFSDCERKSKQAMAARDGEPVRHRVRLRRHCLTNRPDSFQCRLPERNRHRLPLKDGGWVGRRFQSFGSSASTPRGPRHRDRSEATLRCASVDSSNPTINRHFKPRHF